MRLQNPFAALSTTGIDSQVLVVLSRVESYLTVAQIQELLPEGGSVEGVRKSANRLRDQGTVLERVTGRSAAYALNREHLLVGPAIQIAGAKQELLRRLSEQISGWETQPRTVKMFGSAARGDMTETSDIDLLVVMPDESDREESVELVDDLSKQVSRWTGNDTRPLLYFEQEVRPAAIFDSILTDGIDVAGDPSWLRGRVRGWAS